MENLYSKILQVLREDRKAALATIINQRGSSPRGVGANYLVNEDGSASGTIGGGCLEAAAHEGGQYVIRKGAGKVMHFSLTAEQTAEWGLICGGNVDILIEPLKKDFIEIYEEALSVKEKGGYAVLATLVSIDGSFPKEGGSKMLVKSQDDIRGTFVDMDYVIAKILDEKAALFGEKKPRVLSLRPESETSSWKIMEILLEPVFSEPTVYIFGAGHISEQLAPLAKKVRFKVVVLDDREKYASRGRFPDADDVIVSEFESCFDRISVNGTSFLVIVTRGHLYDSLVLEKALGTDAAYIGMIGSKGKVRTIYNQLVKKGISKESLDRVHAPIGLDINSETTEEIAVSIIAELIKVRGESH